MKKGKLYIISAPSGAGKTSLVKQLITDIDQLTVSISHTTRSMRKGEKNGVDYFFTKMDDFQQMVSKGEFLEYAQVFDNCYGTSQKSVESSLGTGTDVILEIDWQGAELVRTKMSDCISIFILPPSIKILQQRLESRGQDSEDIISRRMHDAINQMSHFNEFDYLIVNDDFNLALTELKSIIISQKLKIDQQKKNLKTLLLQLIKGGGVFSKK